MSLIDLYINDGGDIRRIGDDPHDMLMIWKGKLWYHNLQNGDGCRLGEESEWYSFVENADEYGYNCDPRKTENSSENPNNSTKATISKMEQVEDEPQTELVRVKYHCINCAENGSYKCSKCDGEMYYKYDKDEPQTCDHRCVQTEVGCERTDCAWK